MLIKQYKYLDCDPNFEWDAERLNADIAALEKVRALALSLIRTIGQQKQLRVHYHPTLDALDDFKLHVQESLIETLNSAISAGDDLLSTVNER